MEKRDVRVDSVLLLLAAQKQKRTRLTAAEPRSMVPIGSLAECDQWVSPLQTSALHLLTTVC